MLDGAYLIIPFSLTPPTTISTMGKKQKEETPNNNATPNRDIIQRLNFLFQASVYLQSLEPSTSIPISNHPSFSGKSRPKSKGKAKEIQITESSKHTTTSGKKKKHKRKLTTGDLARNYVQCMRIVGQKTTVKMYEEVLFPILFEFQLIGFSRFLKVTQY